jgi:hypothetical protein
MTGQFPSQARQAASTPNLFTMGLSTPAGPLIHTGSAPGRPGSTSGADSTPANHPGLLVRPQHAGLFLGTLTRRNDVSLRSPASRQMRSGRKPIVFLTDGENAGVRRGSSRVVPARLGDALADEPDHDRVGALA